MKDTRYHIGGWLRDATAENKAEEWDSETGTYTAWDDRGNVVEQRPFTSGEDAAFRERVKEEARTTNQAAIVQQARTAVSSNASYLAIGTPTNAQVAAQVRALTQQNNKIIRVLLGVVLGDRSQLDSTN